MNRNLILVAALALALAGCQAKSSGLAATANAAPGPKAIPALHAETLVYECPQCGMDYDGPGKCATDGSTLVKTAVSYTCPSDGKPVEHSGKCPRCAASAMVNKTPIADANPGGTTGGQ